MRKSPTPKFKDITAQTFGRWTVIKREADDRHGFARWSCVCECGNEAVVLGMHLRSGHSKSCGCFHSETASETARTHGASKTKTYDAWSDMKSRCINPNSQAYHYYGARGITVCDRWLNSFENFYEDMGECPPKLTLERRDNNLGYCKENCSWESRKVQSNNTRSNVILEFNGKKMTIVQWARELRFNPVTISTRLSRGWSVARTLTEPVGPYARKNLTL